jgi:hypothetical protein
MRSRFPKVFHRKELGAAGGREGEKAVFAMAGDSGERNSLRRKHFRRAGVAKYCTYLTTTDISAMMATVKEFTE